MSLSLEHFFSSYKILKLDNKPFLNNIVFINNFCKNFSLKIIYMYFNLSNLPLVKLEKNLKNYF